MNRIKGRGLYQEFRNTVTTEKFKTQFQERTSVLIFRCFYLSSVSKRSHSFPFASAWLWRFSLHTLSFSSCGTAPPPLSSAFILTFLPASFLKINSDSEYIWNIVVIISVGFLSFLVFVADCLLHFYPLLAHIQWPNLSLLLLGFSEFIFISFFFIIRFFCCWWQLCSLKHFQGCCHIMH